MTYKVFTMGDGLAQNYVNSVAIGPDGIVWIGTNNGVSRFITDYITVETPENTPTEIEIIGNFPNPFNPSTTIFCSIAKPGHVTIEIYNILGQKVVTLFEGHSEAGEYSVQWDASNQANGIYIAVMKAGGITKTEKMMLLK